MPIPAHAPYEGVIIAGIICLTVIILALVVKCLLVKLYTLKHPAVQAKSEGPKEDEKLLQRQNVLNDKLLAFQENVIKKRWDNKEGVKEEVLKEIKEEEKIYRDLIDKLLDPSKKPEEHA